MDNGQWFVFCFVLYIEHAGMGWLDHGANKIPIMI